MQSIIHLVPSVMLGQTKLGRRGICEPCSNMDPVPTYIVHMSTHIHVHTAHSRVPTTPNNKISTALVINTAVRWCSLQINP